MAAHTSFIMLPVYGMAVFLEPMFLYLTRHKVNALLRGMCYALMIFACEYFSGKVLNRFGICPWVYTSPLNIEGVIRLDYTPLWVVAGIVYEQIFIKRFCLSKADCRVEGEKTEPKAA